jgi:voltage-gated potassium channel
VNVLLRKPLTAARAARIIASVTVSVTIVAGVLIHFTDKKNFPNIGDSLWWAIQTVTTVGYGDLVPTSSSGRLVAALVMVIGIGFLTVISAAITSTFIETARRRIEDTMTDALSAKLDRIGARLDAIEARLEKTRGQDRGDPPTNFSGPKVRLRSRPGRHPWRHRIRRGPLRAGGSRVPAGYSLRDDRRCGLNPSHPHPRASDGGGSGCPVHPLGVMTT